MFIDVGRIPSIGHPRIDDAHRSLAEAVNILFEQWRSGVSSADLRAGFELFLRAAARHFAEEEEIAAAAGCPGVDLHARKHRALLEALTRQIHALTGKDGAGAQGDQRIDVFSLIDAMLHEHEILDDQEFWPVLHVQGCEVPPPAAGPLIAWSTCLDTGQPEVDRQHRILAELLNGLDRAIGVGAPVGEVAVLLDRVVEHARCHFRWEERQMAAAGTDDAGLHALLHDQLLDDLGGILGAVREGGAGRQADLAGLPGRLRIWFVDHIIHVDGDVAAFTAGAAAPSPSGPRTAPEWSPPQAGSAR
ncbi:hemerythrin domain-containing protein [Novispirillum sp. DQ9]|uniref:hemerythrin domain-containing protein n=1 Tax=Novispirillum sp. DQ9 TaxID=3398612 RepID=UPI003C7C78DF